MVFRLYVDFYGLSRGGRWAGDHPVILRGDGTYSVANRYDPAYRDASDLGSTEIGDAIVRVSEALARAPIPEQYLKLGLGDGTESYDYRFIVRRVVSHA